MSDYYCGQWLTYGVLAIVWAIIPSRFMADAEVVGPHTFTSIALLEWQLSETIMALAFLEPGKRLLLARGASSDRHRWRGWLVDLAKGAGGWKEREGERGDASAHISIHWQSKIWMPRPKSTPPPPPPSVPTPSSYHTQSWGSQAIKRCWLGGRCRSPFSLLCLVMAVPAVWLFMTLLCFTVAELGAIWKGAPMLCSQGSHSDHTQKGWCS